MTELNEIQVGLEVGNLASGRRDVLKAGFATGVATAASLISTFLFSDFAYAQNRARRPGPAPAGGKAGDIKIMNTALALEHQAIAAYDVGAGTGLLKDFPLEMAKHFQSQHRAHRDLLEETIKKFGGTPVAPLAKYEFDTSKVKTAEDVFIFALALEAGAASAYLQTLTSLATKDLVPVVAGIACDESQHAAALRMALKQQPAPDAVVR
jgi:rubrerythrin